MTDVTWGDPAAKHNWAQSQEHVRKWPAKRPGETMRTCPTCGTEYEPRSRNQKYCCKECRPSERKDG